MLVISAIMIPQNSDIKNEYIQFKEECFNINVVVHVITMKDNMLIHNFIPNFKLKVFLAIINCIRHVTNCTLRLVNAAPWALKIGMKMKLRVMLIITPIIATKLSCFKLPLAVSSVPKMYVIDMDTKLPIRICSIFDDS